MKTRIPLRVIAAASILMVGSFIMDSGAIVITDGLVAGYSFSGNAGDDSGNGNDGTVYGAQLTTDRFGNVDSAYQFDGTSSFIEVADSVDLRLAQTDFTISSWSNPMGLNANHNALLAKRGLGSNNGWMHTVQTLDAASVRPFYIVSGGNYDPRVYGTAVIPLNAWVHMALTYDLSTQTARFYVNGELSSEHGSVPSPIASATSSLIIGGDSSAGIYRFNGAIDDISIYNRALSVQEITELYEAIPEPASIGLIGLFTGSIYFVRRFFVS